LTPTRTSTRVFSMQTAGSDHAYHILFVALNNLYNDVNYIRSLSCTIRNIVFILYIGNM